MNISESRIDNLLAANSMRRKDLAEKAGVSSSNLSTILRRGSCTSLTAGRIAKGLGVPVEQITVTEVRE